MITIYVDLSETVTGRSTHAQTAPLYTLVGAIRELLKRNTLLRDGDALSVIAFGDGQRPLYETNAIDAAARSDIDRRLSMLESSGWENSAFVHDKIDDVAAFSRYTKFPAVLQDMAARLQKNHEGDRQLLFIASDFANDPDGGCDSRVHLANFERAFTDAITPSVEKLFQRADGNPPLAQLTLLRVPAVASTACDKMQKRRKAPDVDLVVAAGVVKQFRRLYPHDVPDVQQLSVDQLLRRLEAAFSATLQVTSAEKAGPTSIRAEVFNPNCTDVTITGIRVTAAGLPAHEVDFEKPLELRRDRPRDSGKTKDDQELAKYMNRLVDVAPVVGDATTSPGHFWIGDIVRIKSVIPKLYPRFVGTGRVLLFIDANFNVSDGGTLNVRVADPPEGLGGDWSNEIVLPRSDSDREGRWILPLDASAEAIKSLAERGNLRVEVQTTSGGGGSSVGDQKPDRAPEVVWKGATSDAGWKNKEERAEVDIVGEVNKFALPVAAFATVAVLLLTIRERRAGIHQGKTPAEVASVAFTTTYGCLFALLWVLYLGSDGWPWFGRLLQFSRVWAPVPVLTEAIAAGLFVFMLGREYLWRVRFRNNERRTDLSVADSNALLNRGERAVVYSSFAVTAVLAITLSSGFHPTFMMLMRKATA